MSGKRLDFIPLTASDIVTPVRLRPAASELWRRILAGERVFIPGRRPSDLSHWYSKAHKAGFDLTMTRGTIKDGTEGTEVRRATD